MRRMLIFSEVVRLGSLTAAANELGFTISALSQQVAKLEREVGQPLLVRQSRGVVPTDAGVALARHAEAIAGQLRAARAELDEFIDLRRGELRLAAFPTAGLALLPTVVTLFKQNYPDITLNVYSTRMAGLLDRLSRRECDLALLWDYPWDRRDSPQLSVTPLLDDPWLAIVPRHHPLARRRVVALTDLQTEDWVLRLEPRVAEVVHRVCAEAGFEPRVTFRANDYQELQALVAAGLGVSIAPRMSLIPAHPGLRCVPLAGNPAVRRITVARLAGDHATPVIKVGVRVLRQAVGQLSAAQGW